MNTDRKVNRKALLGALGLGLALGSREALKRLRQADLKGQVVLITGGSRGLGFLLAREFAREGCRIAICARDDLELERARQDLEHEGAEVFAVNRDVADRGQVVGAAMPLISMDTERAARQIVSATKRGDSEIILSVPANLLSCFHGIFPGTTTNLLGLVNRALLPPPDGAGAEAERGMEIQERIRSPLFNTLTAWGRSAARRFHEYPGPLEVLARAEKGRKAA